MTTIKLICLVIMLICTLVMIASAIISEIKIRRNKKELKKLAERYYETFGRYSTSVSEIIKSYEWPSSNEEDNEGRNGSE